MWKAAWYLFLFIHLSELCLSQDVLPEGFVYLDQYIPGLVIELRYTTSDNFMGRKVEGYHGRRPIATIECAKALKKAQEEFNSIGLTLKVFDAYRPQQAVDHFVRWARNPRDTAMKADYYPHVNKDQLFRKGYIAAKSGHSRGSTVDVSLVSLSTGEELDMGTPFDFFSPLSSPYNNDISEEQQQNRRTLQRIMEKHGFIHLPTEWWHFTLDEEPYPQTYFNFPVE